jgi:ammonia channel protein AmtB
MCVVVLSVWCVNACEFSCLRVDVFAVIAGVLFMASSSALVKLKIDDPLDAFPVHGVCGIWGVIAVGFFAKQRFVEDVVGHPADDYGVIYGVSLCVACVGLTAEM